MNSSWNVGDEHVDLGVAPVDDPVDERDFLADEVEIAAPVAIEEDPQRGVAQCRRLRVLRQCSAGCGKGQGRQQGCCDRDSHRRATHSSISVRSRT